MCPKKFPYRYNVDRVAGRNAGIAESIVGTLDLGSSDGCYVGPVEIIR